MRSSLDLETFTVFYSRDIAQALVNRLNEDDPETKYEVFEQKDGKFLIDCFIKGSDDEAYSLGYL
jgi:hypothetical protein